MTTSSRCLESTWRQRPQRRKPSLRMRKAKRNRPRQRRQSSRLKRRRPRPESNAELSALRALFRPRRPNSAKKVSPQKPLALERLRKSLNRRRPPPRRRPRRGRRRSLQWKRARPATTPKPAAKAAPGRQNGSSLAQGKAAGKRPGDTSVSGFAIHGQFEISLHACLMRSESPTRPLLLETRLGRAPGHPAMPRQIAS